MVSVLSGGEKSRLYLCQLIHQNPNLLIMDEPTNHLDIDMADALLEALKQYKGTVIFVSHDRWFLSELASKFWVFTKVSDAHGIHTTIVEPDCDWQQAIALAFSEPEKEKTVAPPREKKKDQSLVSGTAPSADRGTTTNTGQAQKRSGIHPLSAFRLRHLQRSGQGAKSAKRNVQPGRTDSGYPDPLERT